MHKIIEVWAESAPYNKLKISALMEGSESLLEAEVDEDELRRLAPDTFMQPVGVMQHDYDSPPEPRRHEPISFNEWCDLYLNNHDILKQAFWAAPIWKVKVTEP